MPRIRHAMHRFRAATGLVARSVDAEDALVVIGSGLLVAAAWSVLSRPAFEALVGLALLLVWQRRSSR